VVQQQQVVQQQHTTRTVMHRQLAVVDVLLADERAHIRFGVVVFIAFLFSFCRVINNIKPTSTHTALDMLTCLFLFVSIYLNRLYYYYVVILFILHILFICI
jgi:hypothetical protein